jgi:hypothetical protein
MPRQARVFQRALCYHVMNRGINRRELFADEADREEFLELVKDKSSPVVGSPAFAARLKL